MRANGDVSRKNRLSRSPFPATRRAVSNYYSEARAARYLTPVATETAAKQDRPSLAACLTPFLLTDHSAAACVSEESSMTMERNVDSDPFAEPDVDDEPQFVIDSTLSVGRNASLTLGTDSLIVLGMSLPYVKSSCANRFNQTKDCGRRRAYTAAASYLQVGPPSFPLCIGRGHGLPHMPAIGTYPLFLNQNPKPLAQFPFSTSSGPPCPKSTSQSTT
jgi:hypothetical protein